jgi:Tfp pilus assembly protein PilO
MTLKLSSTNRVILAMLVIAALGAAFWILLLAPKREEAEKLGSQISVLKASLAQHRTEVAEAKAARREFPAEYERLVVLGKAVPGDDDVASLLVQVNRTADRAGVSFDNLELTASSEEGEAPPAPPAEAPGGSPVSATEATASLLPLGATVGPAGLGVMPYTLTFSGDFFEIADFIKELDSLVNTRSEEVVVDGRLVTIDGFSLTADKGAGFPSLEATFSVTTYLTPPGQGVTGGATPSTPGTATATPASTTLGGAP